MSENTTSLSLTDTYLELWRTLITMGCQILKAIPPYAIAVRQGSWFGVFPESMAKHIRFELTPNTRGTKIRSDTYWPTVLAGCLAMGYTTCLFSLFLATIIFTQQSPVPLLRTPYGYVIMGLTGLVVLLVILHLYSYLGRNIVARRILITLRVRGSPLHIKRTQQRIRYWQKQPKRKKDPFTY